MEAPAKVAVDLQWVREQWIECVYNLINDPQNYSNDEQTVLENFERLCEIGEALDLHFWDTATEVTTRENIADFRAVLEREARTRPWDNVQAKLEKIKELNFLQGVRANYLTNADIEQLISAIEVARVDSLPSEEVTEPEEVTKEETDKEETIPLLIEISPPLPAGEDPTLFKKKGGESDKYGSDGDA